MAKYDLLWAASAFGSVKISYRTYTALPTSPEKLSDRRDSLRRTFRLACDRAETMADCSLHPHSVRVSTSSGLHWRDGWVFSAIPCQPNAVNFKQPKRPPGTRSIYVPFCKRSTDELLDKRPQNGKLHVQASQIVQNLYEKARGNSPAIRTMLHRLWSLRDCAVAVSIVIRHFEP